MYIDTLYTYIYIYMIMETFKNCHIQNDAN